VAQTDVEVAIVGAGVVGCAAASLLAARGRSVALLEAGPRIAEGVTSRELLV
jgi:flavin-dependent dehydrogenase